nr:hypothetical protein CFP56_41190 [Quercus suber]
MSNPMLTSLWDREVPAAVQPPIDLLILAWIASLPYISTKVQNESRCSALRLSIQWIRESVVLLPSLNYRKLLSSCNYRHVSLSNVDIALLSSYDYLRRQPLCFRLDYQQHQDYSAVSSYLENSICSRRHATFGVAISTPPVLWDPTKVLVIIIVVSSTVQCSCIFVFSHEWSSHGGGIINVALILHCVNVRPERVFVLRSSRLSIQRIRASAVLSLFLNNGCVSFICVSFSLPLFCGYRCVSLVLESISLPSSCDYLACKLRLRTHLRLATVGGVVLSLELQKQSACVDLHSPKVDTLQTSTGFLVHLLLRCSTAVAFMSGAMYNLGGSDEP